MPARDLRDQMQQGENPLEPQVQDVAQQSFLNPLQIPMDSGMQKMAVGIVMSDFDSAKNARESRDYGKTSKGETLDFDKWLKELNDLYFGRRIPKTIPWRFCSNRSLMIGMAILEVMHARLFPAVYNEEALNWRPVKKTSEAQTDQLNKVMGWWVTVHCKLKEFFSEWVRVNAGYGDSLVETDLDIQMVERDFGIERIVKTASHIISKKDVFLQAGARDIQRDPVILRVTYFYRDLEQMEREGKLVNVSTPSQPGMPTLKDLLPVQVPPSDGNQSPEAVEELKNIKRRNLPVTCLKWYGQMDTDLDGFAEQVRLLVSPDYRIYLGGVRLRDISYRGLRHLDFTRFMPRLDEPQMLAGIGVLEQVKELALEIDACFNQMTDSNTMQIMRPGFYDPSGDMDAGAIQLAPNKMIPVSNPSQNIYFPDIQIPTERLVIAIRLVVEFIEKLTAASAYEFGNLGATENVGGSGTATRTQAIVGAANQRNSIPADSLKRGVSRILTHHLDLVQKNSAELIPGLEDQILDEKGDPIFGQNVLSQESIAGEYDAYLAPDESFGSKDMERQLGSMLYQILSQNLIVATDPVKLYKVTADFMLKPYGKDPEKYLGPPPEMAEALSPEEEQALILSGQLSKVKPNVLQNQLEHIMRHQEFLQSPAIAELPPNVQQVVVQFTEQLIAQHMQIMQLMMQMAQKSQQMQQKGVASAPNKPGAQGGRLQGAQAIGPEPSVGSPQSPLSQAMSSKRGGESNPPSGF